MSSIASRRRTVIPVFEHQQYVIPVSVKPRHRLLGVGTAVYANGIRSQSRCLRHEIQHPHGVVRDLQVRLPVCGVNVDRDETVAFLERACSARNAGGAIRGSWRGGISGRLRLSAASGHGDDGNEGVDGYQSHRAGIEGMGWVSRATPRQPTYGMPVDFAARSREAQEARAMQERPGRFRDLAFLSKSGSTTSRSSLRSRRLDPSGPAQSRTRRARLRRGS